MTKELSTRDRLLLVGAELLEHAEGGAVSTRAITEKAGVQAPTLYHHFGSKQALLDEVVSHGFRRFLQDNPAPADEAGRISAIARAWDTHVRFGVEHPAFYAHIYARVEPGYRCGVVSVVEQMLLEALERARSVLAVDPAQAARMILAASTGVILTLISELDGDPHWELSERVRDAILDSLVISGGAR
ncbi:TetR/AcrR family transcriptional regulator [Sphaerisporangium album]|uniref:TetR/AcrR family transcriptional regulator n=1 Tax=Sphaerisporangium album TaxID=509200 RepID=A0A367FRC0_9ACTN|nr:TetR/AcrR family transcriptional regulator [Sphaerisporangium album]RCG32774.1 TetR/AcrR family transcriptional regulator [Sphaerisporangium album]